MAEACRKDPLKFKTWKNSRGPGHVGNHRLRHGAALLAQPGRLEERLFAPRCQDEAAAVLGECQCSGAADAAAGTGDHHHTAIECSL